jgi:formate hydrogenlyase transcriptional activator
MARTVFAVESQSMERTEEATQSSLSLDAEARYRLLVEVSAAANSQLEIAAVLGEVAHALEPFLPVDGVSVTTVDGDSVMPHSIHVRGVEHRRGDSFADVLTRWREAHEGADASLPAPMPLAGSGTEHVGRTRRAYVCDDLTLGGKFSEDGRLRDKGIRSYVRIPLFVHERLVGSMVFIRTEPHGFAPHDVEILEVIAQPIAAAVANALAFEEIARLNSRLQDENEALRQELDERSMFEEIVGSSKPLRRMLSHLEKVAATESTVLITGETGTGKELVARAIHRRSRRADRALITVNCAALPGTLIGSELFGHERGAFTGAQQRRLGRFELADGGSLFLDEVGELPPEMQVALLRVLQEGEIERVGGTQTIRVDTRVIAATNRDLGAAVAEGTFRSDLFYRLNVFPIEVPALRERREDIPILVEYFVTRFAARLGKKFRQIERGAMDRILAYPWPGNVRELQNVIERAVILSEGDTLRIDEPLAAGAVVSPPEASLPDTLRGHARRQIEEALAAAGGRVSGANGAAARLGVPATTLESRIKSLKIDKRRFRPDPAA